MADDKRIHELDELTTPQSNDLLVMEQVSSNVDKKVKMSNFMPTDTIATAVNNYLDGHSGYYVIPDGNVTMEKLATDVHNKFDEKADIDGYYEDMSVGSAEQLLSNMYETDNAPYLNRTSGGSLEIGDREYKKLVGVSIPWNQIIPDNQAHKSGTSTTSSWITTSQFSLISGHKYLLVRSGTYSAENNAARVVSTESPTIIYDHCLPTSGTYQTSVFSCTATRDTYYIQAYAVAEEAYDFYLNVFDLSLMFGNAIADYVYTLEQSEAGSGIAYLKSYGYLTKDYYDYNAGAMYSVKTSAHKTTGFNQWDEEWEAGTIYSDGTPIPSQTNNQIRSKNYCPIFPNTVYYATCQKTDGGNDNKYYLYINYYDENKNFISKVYCNRVTFTTPSNARYFKLNTNSSSVIYGNTYNHDICINLHWDGERDGEYEAYSEHVYALDSDLELRGVPKLDSANKLYYEGDTYESDGTVTRKYGIVDLGTLPWESLSGVAFLARTGIDSANSNLYSDSNRNILISTAKYTPIGNWNNINETISDFSCGVYLTQVRISDSTYTDAATFKAAMSGVYLVYELATPTTESADPFTSPQIVDNWGTEEFVDTRTVQIPVGHETDYVPDLKAKLESVPNNPSTNGKYFLQYQNGEATYVPVPSEVPEAPSEDGTYVLKATVSSGTATLSWVAEE